jgi:hypothetical protein
MKFTAGEQLRLVTGSSIPASSAAPGIERVDASGRDARLPIEKLFTDIDFLCDQRYAASQLMSRGMAYGWRPKFECV